MPKSRSDHLLKLPVPRTHRACNFCKAKKAKCDGCKPCRKCRNNDQLCSFAKVAPRDRKSPPGYVDSLEYQQRLLSMAVRKLHSQRQSSTSNKDTISIHERLEELGLIGTGDDGSHDALQHLPYRFIEDLSQLHSTLIGDTSLLSSKPDMSRSDISSSPSSSKLDMSSSDISTSSSASYPFLGPGSLSAAGSDEEVFADILSLELEPSAWFLDCNVPAQSELQDSGLPKFNPVTDSQVQKAIKYLRGRNGGENSMTSQAAYSDLNHVASS